MRKAPIYGLLVVFILAPLSPASSQSEDAEMLEAELNRMLELSGAANMASQVLHQIMAPIRQAIPQVPEEFWVRMMDRFDGQELVELTIPIYARHFTLEEIRDINAFYESPTGRKMIGSLPAIMQESMAVGQAWGEKAAGEIIQELEAEGFEPPGA